MLGKTTVDDILKDFFFFFFFQKIDVDISCKLICVTVKAYFQGKNKKKYQFVICWICPKSCEG